MLVSDTVKVTGVEVTVEPFEGVTSETESEPAAVILLRELDNIKMTAENTNTTERTFLSLNRAQTKESRWPFLLSFVTLNQSHGHSFVG